MKRAKLGRLSLVVRDGDEYSTMLAELAQIMKEEDVPEDEQATILQEMRGALKQVLAERSLEEAASSPWAPEDERSFFFRVLGEFEVASKEVAEAIKWMMSLYPENSCLNIEGDDLDIALLTVEGIPIRVADLALKRNGAVLELA